MEAGEPKRTRFRAYDRSIMEVVLRIRQYFEHEKRVHRRINLSKDYSSRISKQKLGMQISTMEDVLSCSKLPGLSATFSPNQPMSEYFSSVVHHTI